MKPQLKMCSIVKLHPTCFLCVDYVFNVSFHLLVIMFTEHGVHNMLRRVILIFRFREANQSERGDADSDDDKAVHLADIIGPDDVPAPAHAGLFGPAVPPATLVWKEVASDVSYGLEYGNASIIFYFSEHRIEACCGSRLVLDTSAGKLN